MTMHASEASSAEATVSSEIPVDELGSRSAKDNRPRTLFLYGLLPGTRAKELGPMFEQ